jgi:hypothetical protein
MPALFPVAAAKPRLTATKDSIQLRTRVAFVALARRPEQAQPPNFTVKMQRFLRLSATHASVPLPYRAVPAIGPASLYAIPAREGRFADPLDRLT